MPAEALQRLHSSSCQQLITDNKYSCLISMQFLKYCHVTHQLSGRITKQIVHIWQNTTNCELCWITSL